MSNIFRDFERQNKKGHLHQIMLYKFEFFEVATKETINSLKIELQEATEKYEKGSAKIPHIDEHNVGDISGEEWQLIDDVGEYYMNMEFSEQYLISLFEMRIVYLFKNLEIVMKNMILTAYPQSNISDFYKWENMKTFFKTKDIDISKIDGYNDCLDVKKVNNSIKHSETIGEEVKKINEFKDAQHLTSENLEKFNERIRPKIEAFCENLRQCIEDDLYVFSEQRINDISKEYYERMDDDKLKILIQKLSDKIK